MQRIVCYNKNLLCEEDTPVSPFNRGLHYGDGVFETLRSYAGRFFRFKEHMNRFMAGLKLLRIQADWSSAEMLGAAKEVLKANNLSDASVKFIAFRNGAEGPAPPPDLKASVLISAGPFDSRKKLRCEKGMSAYIVSGRRNIYSPLAFLKSLNYLDNILGKFEARDNNADEALFLNIHGMVAEGATSNIFIIRQEVLYTPPLHAGILNGITRGVVLQIATEAGIKCMEKEFSPDHLFAADEAFLTNSLMEIMPLVSVNSRPVGSGTPGDITAELMDKYSSRAGKETGVKR